MPLTHDRFTIDRDFAVPRATIWRLWSEPDLKRQWFVENDGPGWSLDRYDLDFSIGGSELARWTADDPGKPWHGVHENRSTFIDITPQERIITAYTMRMNDDVHSAVLLSVSFEALAQGSRITLTEQLSLYDGSYGAAGRRDGWTKLLGGLDDCAQALNG